MTRSRGIALALGALLVILIAWIGSNTYWGEMTIQMPLKGEARSNPFYATQRFAEALGARTSWDHVFTAPPPEAIVVLSAWHWNLTARRRQTLEAWVASGGRLVVDRSLIGGEEEFRRWTGVSRTYHRDKQSVNSTFEANPERCLRLAEGQRPEGAARAASYEVCDLDGISSLATSRAPVWSLRETTGPQALRVNLGRGTVTVINTVPFRHLSLFDGDHGRLFVAATQLRRGDEVHFLSEDDHPSLVALVWRYGAPVVLLVLAVIALGLWRGSVRFGPLTARPDKARRSLAEQIRGTGEFALHFGSGESLHAAAVRALGEAAGRRVPSYEHLSPDDRITVLARLTGFDPYALAGALLNAGPRRPGDLRSALALLETARRRMLIETRSSHGTR